MRTIDLRTQPATLEDALGVATSEVVRIVTATGREFILEDAHAFEREVATHCNSQTFMNFLSERAQQTERRSLADVELELK